MADSVSFDRLALVGRLNWDYDVDPGELLSVIDGTLAKAGPFDTERLLVRSLERLGWYAVLALWGADHLAKMNPDSILPRIRSPELRKRYEFAFKLLRGEALPATGWSTELRRRVHRIMRHGFLSHRWDRTQPVL